MAAGDYAAEPETLGKVGRDEHGLAPDADSAVSRVLQSYSDAADTVIHPLVSGALSTYRETHQRGHLMFPAAIRELGVSVVDGANMIVDDANESTTVLKPTAYSAEGLVGKLNQAIQR